MMEAAAEDRAGWREVICGLRSTGSDKATDQDQVSPGYSVHLCNI